MDGMMAHWIDALGWSLLDFLWQGLLVGCATALPLAGLWQRLATASPAAEMAPGAASALAQLAPLPPVALAPAGLADMGQHLGQRLPLVVLLWACGAALLALRLTAGLWWVARRSRSAGSLPAPYWQARVDVLARRFGITRAVRLGVVGDLPGPVTAGLWRPVLLLPASLLTGMPPELLEALLAHELAHIRRLDYLVNLVQSAIEILLFYHPAVWWLSHRIRIEREQVADDLAASMLGEPRRLALALSELAQGRFSTPHLAHAAHGGNLMSRIKRLVRPDVEPLNWKMALPILGIAATCLAFYVQSGTANAAGQTTPAAAAAPASSAEAAQAHKAAVSARAEAARAERQAERAARKAEHRTADPEQAFALVRRGQEGHVMSGGRTDQARIEALKRSVDGDFLWFRQGKDAYVVQDPAILAKALEAWAPLDKLGEQMDGYGKQMDQHGKVMESLGAEMAAAAEGMVPARADHQQFEREIRDLARQQAKLAGKVNAASRKLKSSNDDAKRSAIEAEIAALQATMEALQEQMQSRQESMETRSAGLEHAAAPMEAIGKKMEAAGKPMDELGKLMDALGKQMEKQSQAAERQMRVLLEDALRKGLAKPAPGGAG